MISRADLINDTKYFGAKIGENFKLIGYVDVKHKIDDTTTNLVFHSNLTVRDLSEVEGMTAEEIEALAQTEADTILQGEAANKCQDDYITLYNLGLYGTA